MIPSLTCWIHCHNFDGSGQDSLLNHTKNTRMFLFSVSWTPWKEELGSETQIDTCRSQIKPMKTVIWLRQKPKHLVLSLNDFHCPWLVSTSLPSTECRGLVRATGRQKCISFHKNKGLREKKKQLQHHLPQSLLFISSLELTLWTKCLCVHLSSHDIFSINLISVLCFWGALISSCIMKSTC
jgi:hypothetical protein